MADGAPSSRPGIGRAAAWALLMAAAAWAVAASGAGRSLLLIRPAAVVAGLLSGAPCRMDGPDPRLVGPDLDLTVAPECAAADYLVLMTLFLGLLAAARGVRWPWLALVLPAAWGLTVLVNGARLVACWQTERLTRAVLPPAWGAIAHLAVGVATFLLGLMPAWTLFSGSGSLSGSGSGSTCASRYRSR